ncbi:MAG: hypothetical protein IPI67_34430 [Myxococcales bacterium]|nr:hypothetical protein [Myxococcales bacterium]
MPDRRRSLAAVCLTLAFVACSSTTTNPDGNSSGGSSGSGADGGSGGVSSGGKPSGGAPSGGGVTNGGAPSGGGVTSGGAPSGGGVTSGGAPSGGGAPTGGSGGSGTDAGCSTTDCKAALSCCGPSGSAVQSIEEAMKSAGVCETTSPCDDTFCMELCAATGNLDAYKSCLGCMKDNSIKLNCATGSACAAFEACLGPCAP